MSDDLSPFDRRMLGPGLFALVAGFGLAGLAVLTAQRTNAGAGPPWIAGVPFGVLAAIALYAVMYRNLSRRENGTGQKTS